ncbi:hypothetical protein GCM10025762_12000 [Haloechinothrix salitolerans]
MPVRDVTITQHNGDGGMSWNSGPMIPTPAGWSLISSGTYDEPVVITDEDIRADDVDVEREHQKGNRRDDDR